MKWNTSTTDAMFDYAALILAIYIAVSILLACV